MAKHESESTYICMDNTRISEKTFFVTSRIRGINSYHCPSPRRIVQSAKRPIRSTASTIRWYLDELTLLYALDKDMKFCHVKHPTNVNLNI